ncbi:MAG: superoxide dismutase family protein [Actinomycetota bacterium]
MNKSRNKLVVTATMAGLSALLLMSVPQGASADDPGVRAQLRDASGVLVGAMRLNEEGGRVLIRGAITNLNPGFHGFHVHTTGACSSNFLSAGGHYNPGATTHGAHAGDLPSILVNSDRTAKLSFTTDSFTIAQLLAGDGSAFIVHANKDNFANIPATTVSGAERYHSHTENVFGPDSATRATGDAGSRVACGVIES